MTSRREFLQTGMSVSAWPFAVHGLLSSGVASARIPGNCVALRKAVFDDRYVEGRAFANAVEAFGAPVSALDEGDITALWSDELDRLWRKTPASIAGFTQYGPLFALERLANGRGMRVVLRVEHEVRADGTLAHLVSGPPETIAMARHLSRQGVDWPVLVAALLTHCRFDGSAPLEQTIVTPAATPALTRMSGAGSPASVPESLIHYYTPQAIQQGRGVAWDGPLFSWLIAPRA